MSVARGRDVLTIREDSDDSDVVKEESCSEDSACDDDGPKADTAKEDTIAFHNEPKANKRPAQQSLEGRKKKLTKKDQTGKMKEAKDRLLLALVKPDVTTDREKERLLKRIATKGVVQLFNAVAERQRVMDETLSKKLSMKERKEAEKKLTGLDFDPYAAHLAELQAKKEKEEEDDDGNTSGMKEESDSEDDE